MTSGSEDLPADARSLRRFLAAHGLRPRRRLGQHFMVAPRALEALVAAAALAPGERVLEVGTGTGLLTRRLLAAGARVLTLEADARLAAAVSPALAAGGAQVVVGDVLAGPEGLHPAAAAWIAAAGEGGYKVVANLPYATAVPFLLAVLRGAARPALLAVTLQREVAARLLARAGSPAYGRLSVEVQLRSRVEAVRALPPSVFWPRPAVASTLLSLVPHPARMQPAPRDEGAFLRFLERVFAQRRKQLRTLLRGEPAAAALTRLGLPPGARAEALAPAQLVALFETLASRPETPPPNTLPPPKGCGI